MPNPPISIEKIEAMFEAYTEKQSIAHVSKAAGVSYPTAKRYIEQGDAKRGIEPLAFRLRRLVRQVARKTERKVAYGHAEQMAETAVQLQGLDDLIFEAVNVLKGKLDSTKLRLTDVAKAIQVRNQVVQMLAEKTETTTVEEVIGSYFDGWTPEQIRAYGETGSRFADLDKERARGEVTGEVPEVSRNENGTLGTDGTLLDAEGLEGVDTGSDVDRARRSPSPGSVGSLRSPPSPSPSPSASPDPPDPATLDALDCETP